MSHARGAPPERIRAAAILHEGRLIEAIQHWACWIAYYGGEDAVACIYPDAEGFVTTTGRFVDRTEATHIARRARQIRPEYAADAVEFGAATELGAEWLQPEVAPGGAEGRVSGAATEPGTVSPRRSGR